MASTRRWLDRGNPRDAGARHACQGIFTDNEKALAYAGAFPLDWNRPCPVKRLHIFFAGDGNDGMAVYCNMGGCTLTPTETAIQEAMEVEDVFTKDEVAKRSYEKAEKFRRDQAAQIRYATEEGRQEGRKEGEEKGILGTIAVLKSLNWDKKTIALKLVEVFGLDDKAANGYVDANW